MAWAINSTRLTMFLMMIPLVAQETLQHQAKNL